jgi:hypothetical protein
MVYGDHRKPDGREIEESEEAIVLLMGRTTKPLRREGPLLLLRYSR